MTTPKPLDNSEISKGLDEWFKNPVFPDEVRAEADKELEEQRKLNAPSVPVIFPSSD